jgi:hypothetical protein
LYNFAPPVGILNLPPLDALQSREKLCEDWAGLFSALSDIREGVIARAARDGADRDEGSGSTGGNNLSEALEFLVFDLWD